MHLLAGVDAAKVLRSPPVIMACLTQTLLFLLCDVDRTILCLVNEPNDAPRFDVRQLTVNLALALLKIIYDVHRAPRDNPANTLDQCGKHVESVKTRFAL